MDKVKLHYAKIDLEGDIPVFEFEEDESGFFDIDLVCKFIDDLYPGDFYPENIVFLIAHKDDIFISNSLENIVICAKAFFNDFGTSAVIYSDDSSIYLQEYPSYEEAYEVALSMKEENKLCYSSETKDSPYWKKASKEFMDTL